MTETAKTQDAPESDPKTTPRPRRTVPALEFLPVTYTGAEIIALAQAQARAEESKEQLCEQFEALKLKHKSELETVENSIRQIARKIRKNTHYENVDCIYILEDPTPREKTLIRLDTGEIVRVVPMDSRDYQDPLPTVLKPETPVVSNDCFTLAPPAVNGKDQPAPAPPAAPSTTYIA